MRALAFFLLVSGSAFLSVSCNNEGGKTASDPVKKDSIQNNVTPPQPSFQRGMQVDVKTFEVTDSAGRVSEGWGYDLYVGTKKVIHQPIMPGLPGNNGFKTEADAQKMGELAAKRFSSTGTFPTINLSDFDSLGIKR